MTWQGHARSLPSPIRLSRVLRFHRCSASPLTGLRATRHSCTFVRSYAVVRNSHRNCPFVPSCAVVRDVRSLPASQPSSVPARLSSPRTFVPRRRWCVRASQRPCVPAVLMSDARQGRQISFISALRPLLRRTSNGQPMPAAISTISILRPLLLSPAVAIANYQSLTPKTRGGRVRRRVHHDRLPFQFSGRRQRMQRPHAVDTVRLAGGSPALGVGSPPR